MQLSKHAISLVAMTTVSVEKTNGAIDSKTAHLKNVGESLWQSGHDGLRCHSKWKHNYKNVKLRKDLITVYEWLTAALTDSAKIMIYGEANIVVKSVLYYRKFFNRI